MSLILAGIVMAFVPLLVWLMRDRPQDLGLAAYGDTQAGRGRAAARRPATRSRSPSGRWPTGARSRDFWLIAGSYFVCGASTNGLIGTHLIPACVDHGLTEVAGAGLLAATGVFALDRRHRCRAGSATAATTGFCCSGITGCAACR